MKTKIILAVFFSLFAALTANAQSFLKVNESETKANFENNHLQINLVVENSASAITAKVKLEVLDAQDIALASSETLENLRRGKQNLLIPLTFGANADADELLWKRLRYTIAVENSAASISNIVSLSEIMPELFELRVSASEEIYPGMLYLARVRAFHPIKSTPISDVEINAELKIDLETDSDDDELKIE